MQHREPQGKEEDFRSKEIKVAVVGKTRAIAEPRGKVSGPLIDKGDRAAGTSEQSPKLGLDLKDKCAIESPSEELKKSREVQEGILDGLSGIRDMAAKFLQEYHNWELSSLKQTRDQEETPPKGKTPNKLRISSKLPLKNRAMANQRKLG